VSLRTPLTVSLGTPPPCPGRHGTVALGTPRSYSLSLFILSVLSLSLINRDSKACLSVRILSKQLASDSAGAGSVAGGGLPCCGSRSMSTAWSKHTAEGRLVVG
jgi:hypothetical protein